MPKESITITLTGRPPVRVSKDKWPIIASAENHDGKVECQANRRWKMFVRQCEDDGRCIVYGIYTTNFENEDDRRGGEIVNNFGDVPQAAYCVAEYLDFDRRLADECIADLPAEEL